MQFRWLFLALVVVQAIATKGAAAIVALRADDSAGGFTAVTPQLSDAPTHNNPPPGANDDQWGFAADASNVQSQFGSDNEETAGLFNNVWVSRADLGEDCPQLTTTISGLEASVVYNVYFYQVTTDNVASPWGLQAAIAGNPLTTYQLGSGTELESSGNSNFERVLLGQVSGVTSFDVIVDDATNRGFLKGYGVEIAPIPGDFDADGDVDGLDFVAWQTNFPKATAATLADGDGDGDGDVDGADFVVWQTNFPFMPEAALTPVPEPKAMGAALLGSIGLLIFNRTRWYSALKAA